MKNYTPIDVAAMTHDSNAGKGVLDVNIIFLVLILITLVVLAGLLFVLIRQRVEELSFVTAYFA
jgi:hypothetical protein